MRERGRVVGVHFFNPAWNMSLLEVHGITGTTSQHTMDTMCNYATSIGKTPVRGSILNTLMVTHFMQAVRMVERGDARVEDVDVAMRQGAGHPHGPFELMDVIGVDVVRGVVANWHREDRGDPRFFPSAMLDGMVERCELGRKTNRGFYCYS